MKKILFLVLFLLTISVFARGTIVLNRSNTVSLRGPVMGASVSKLMMKMMVMDHKLPKGKPIYLVISSPGGSINLGLEFIEFCKGLGRPIHTVTIFSASMAFEIAQKLNRRYVVDLGTFMQHKASGAFSGDFPGQIDSRYDFWKRRLEISDIETAKRLGRTLDDWRKMYENELWVNGVDAVKTKIADRSPRFKCGASLRGTSTETITIFIYKLNVKYSNCPLIAEPLDVEFAKEYKSRNANKALEKAEKLYYFRSFDSAIINEINKIGWDINK